MSPERRKPKDQPTGEEIQLLQAEAVYKARVHLLLGNRRVSENSKGVTPGPRLETYRRFHANSESISLLDLKEELERVSTLRTSLAGKEGRNWQKPKARFLSGIWRGLNASVYNYSGLPLEEMGILKDKPSLIEDWAKAEAKVILGNGGVKNIQEGSVDPFFSLGEAMGIQRVLGHIGKGKLPTEIPPMPEFLR
jgi:hypothetical protein